MYDVLILQVDSADCWLRVLCSWKHETTREALSNEELYIGLLFRLAKRRKLITGH